MNVNEQYKWNTINMHLQNSYTTTTLDELSLPIPYRKKKR